jgi:hypothetical protein
MKHLIVFLLLSILAALVLSNPTATPAKPPVVTKPSPPPKKKVDTYKPKTDQYCFNKCVKYSSIKGKCTDFNWEGTTKKCVQYKTIGKGKCLEHKRESHCLKYEGPSTICIAHGTRQECAKKHYLTVCEKEEWKKSCAHNSENGKCLEWAHRDICLDHYTPTPAKPDPYTRCDLYSYIPKLECNHKKRCTHYKTDNYCSKYGKKCEKKCKWEEVKQQDLYVPHNAKNSKPVAKGQKKPVDPYAPPKVFKKVCSQVCHKVCDEFSKRVTCDKYEQVKFCKKTGYTQYCAQPAPKVDGYVPPDNYVPKPTPQCKKQKRVKYCIRWTKEKHCDNFKKLRCCLKKKQVPYCAAYKTVSFCTQHEKLEKRCIKKKYTKKCVKKSEGQQVCVKFAFEGGKAKCQHFAQKTVCAKRKRVCSNVKEDNADTINEHGKPKKSHKKGKKHGKKPKKSHGKKKGGKKHSKKVVATPAKH